MASMQVMFFTTAFLCAGTSLGAPVQSESEATLYLKRYGFLNSQTENSDTSSLVTANSFKQAVREFQEFAGLRVTGELDRETEKTMNMPRCGVKDKLDHVSSPRSKRYVVQGSRWRVKNLTYRVSKYPYNMSRYKVDAEMANAFKVWSDQTDLTFTRKDVGTVNIEIRFERGGEVFDGSGGKLAVAFFPQYGGDAFFDESEGWSSGSYTGVNLFQVAAHEFGHSLGLEHSRVSTALMAPFYRGYEPQFRLDADDVKGIWALYGRKSH